MFHQVWQLKQKKYTNDRFLPTNRQTMITKETQTQGSDTSTCMAAKSAIVPLNAISATSLASDDGKTKFYTGLPKWTLLEQLFFLLSTRYSITYEANSSR